MNSFHITAPSKRIFHSIQLPGSKSISNRLLILQAQTENKDRFPLLSAADDTVLMQELLQKISNHMHSDDELVLHCENAGTVLRFLTSYLAITPGNWILTGKNRMLHRPIKSLVDVLVELGANISYGEKEGYPPLKIKGGPLQGGEAVVEASISSQYISSLLLIAPTLPHGLKIKLRGQVVSSPYIQMTLDLLRKFEINSSWEENIIRVDQGHILVNSIDIEPDWSSAAFWYQVVALSPTARIFLPGLSPKSIQGDSLLPDLFKSLGVASSFEKRGLTITGTGQAKNFLELDFKDHPDLALPLIITSGILNKKGRFTGLESLRIKESDRLDALVTILKSLNIPCSVEEGYVLRLSGIEDSQRWKQSLKDIRFNPMGDHRLAMMLAPLSLVAGNIVIEDPQVVSKSYPNYWDEMKKVGFLISSL